MTMKTDNRTPETTMRRIPRVVLVAGLVALAPVLSACESLDLDKLDVFGISEKKKLPGERRAVFPEGVPGVTQGIPQEYIRGQQPPAETADVMPTEPARAAAPAAPPRARAPARPRPATAAAPARRPAPQAQPAAQQPAAWPEPAQARPAQPAPQQDPSPWPSPAQGNATAPWPSAPPPGSFSR